MTKSADHAEMIALLQTMDRSLSNDLLVAIREQAADMIEAQAKRIAELEAALGDVHLYAATLYAITDTVGDTMDTAQRAALADQIVLEIRARSPLAKSTPT